jgi:ABC-type Fe3+ transport system permease subunit
VTGWVTEDFSAAPATALYAAVLLLAGASWVLLQRALVRCNGRDSALARAVGRDAKSNVSTVLYIAAVCVAFVHTWIADLLIVAVAFLVHPGPAPRARRRRERAAVTASRPSRSPERATRELRAKVDQMGDLLRRASPS